MNLFRGGDTSKADIKLVGILHSQNDLSALRLVRIYDAAGKLLREVMTEPKTAADIIGDYSKWVGSAVCGSCQSDFVQRYSRQKVCQACLNAKLSRKLNNFAERKCDAI